MKKSLYSVFVSLSGESSSAGVRTLFIRTRGCNLRCSYCDTAYAQDASNAEEYIQDVRALIIEQLENNPAIRNIILTGGEPLLQFTADDLRDLDKVAIRYNVSIQIETNGSIYLPISTKELKNTCYVMDYKLESSGELSSMASTNFAILSSCDEVKFVVKDETDFNTMIDVITQHSLDTKVRWILVSPLYGVTDLTWLWNQVTTSSVRNLRIQTQLHKLFVPLAGVNFEI